MDQYTDIKIVEANRLHSEEAKGGNNENYSLWTNNLQDILHLNPKDQVSVYGAFISERGAGQQSSIEIKGVELGRKRLFKYINVKTTLSTGDRLDNNLPSGASIIEAELKEETYQIRDDTLRYIQNTFIPANAMNSCHLPRRWMGEATEDSGNWTEHDSRITKGATLTYYNYGTVTPKLWFNKSFYQLTKNSVGEGGEYLLKPNNDNSRYTLMIRDKTYFTENSMTGITDPLPKTDLRDPENAVYHVLREMKSFQIPSGFNSADFIAQEITSQLQAIKTNKIQTQNTTGTDPFPINIQKVIESETYKAIYSGNYDDMTKAHFLKYFQLVGSTGSVADKGYPPGKTNKDGFEWLRQFNIVACKYPELYETGRLINMNYAQVYQGIKGLSTYAQITLIDDGSGDTATADTPLILDVPYNKTNCDLWKAFFDAQKIYPEIIENLNDPNSGYNAGNTIDNTRWLHINRWTNLEMTLDKPQSGANAQLGWGGYYLPRAYTPPATAQLCSLLMCLYFNPDDENTFYDKPIFIQNQFTYGCIGRHSTGRMIIYPFKHAVNGIGSPPINELKLTPTSVPGYIASGRKLGFDLHFNAPGMNYILPLSGYTPRTAGAVQYSEKIGTYTDVPNNEATGTAVAGTAVYNVMPWKKLLYVGADAPKLNWDGTNFSWSDFHTSLNRGNNQYAKDPTIGTSTTDADDFASDVVYKINPIEQYNDWTPDRTPYVSEYKFWSVRNTSTEIEPYRINENIEKWRIYDSLSGIIIEDFGVSEDVWTDSLWGLLGFSYAQFHSTLNRQARIQSANQSQLSVLTTNAEVYEGDTKIFNTNWVGIPLYKNMITSVVNQFGVASSGSLTITSRNQLYPEIIHKTDSIQVFADNLPTRMIRGYYTIRSNILEGNPFIGGKVNNTTMPIIGIVDKVNGDGDFYFGQESSLQFTITKPIRLASLSISIHDPDGSYARTSEQSTILFKVQRNINTTFNVAQEIMMEQKKK